METSSSRYLGNAACTSQYGNIPRDVFICDLFYTVSSSCYIHSNDRMWKEHFGPIWGGVPSFAWRDWGIPRKASVRISGWCDKVWDEDLWIRSRNATHSAVTALDLCNIKKPERGGWDTQTMFLGLACCVYVRRSRAVVAAAFWDGDTLWLFGYDPRFSGLDQMLHILLRIIELTAGKWVVWMWTGANWLSYLKPEVY
jgi:hypothetical protein